jgi:hypothetical protein
MGAVSPQVREEMTFSPPIRRVGVNRNLRVITGPTAYLHGCVKTHYTTSDIVQYFSPPRHLIFRQATDIVFFL